MKQLNNVQDILSAIASVKSRAKEAMQNGDLVAYSRLMGDLFALEQCLVYQTSAMLQDLDNNYLKAA
jgi:hypothetical protein